MVRGPFNNKTYTVEDKSKTPTAKKDKEQKQLSNNKNNIVI